VLPEDRARLRLFHVGFDAHEAVSARGVEGLVEDLEELRVRVPVVGVGPEQRERIGDHALHDARLVADDHRPMPAPPMMRNSVTWASTRTFPPCMVKPASTLPKTMMKPMTVNTAWQLPHP